MPWTSAPTIPARRPRRGWSAAAIPLPVRSPQAYWRQLGLSASGATGTSTGQAGKKPTPVTVGGTTYDAGGRGGAGGPSKGILGLGDGTADPGQHGCVLICVRGG